MQRIRIAVYLSALAWAACFLAPTDTRAQTSSSLTLSRLQTAYNIERNSAARYAAYAIQADKDGHAQLARLFRASAESKRIYANNHAQLIRRMLGKPAATVAMPYVRSTRENLARALYDEQIALNTMYAPYLRQAQAHQHYFSYRVLSYARDAETNQIMMLREAARHLDSLRVAGTIYYVCRDCGMIKTGDDLRLCSNCFHEQFTKIL